MKCPHCNGTGEVKEDSPQYDNPKKFYAYLCDKGYHTKEQEHFIVLLLNNKLQILSDIVTSIGTIDAAMTHSRDVFREAIRQNAARIVIAHNHPSGAPEPSEADFDVTSKLLEAGEILGIQIIDHIVLGHNDYVSLREQRSWMWA